MDHPDGSEEIPVRDEDPVALMAYGHPTCDRCQGLLCEECLLAHCPTCDDPGQRLFSVTNLSH